MGRAVRCGRGADGHRPQARHNTGRLIETRDSVVSAIRSVAGDLTVDAEVRRILVQAVLSSLPPVRVSGVCRT